MVGQPETFDQNLIFCLFIQSQETSESLLLENYTAGQFFILGESFESLEKCNQLLIFIGDSLLLVRLDVVSFLYSEDQLGLKYC